jgi:hypothetical protein
MQLLNNNGQLPPNTSSQSLESGTAHLASCNFSQQPITFKSFRSDSDFDVG